MTSLLKKKNISPLKKLSKRSEEPVSVPEKYKDPEEMNNFEFTEMLEKSGFIDEKKVLNFNVEKYYNNILTMKSAQSDETEALKKTFKMRVKEKNDKNKMPWERARDNGENIIKAPVIS